MWQKAFSELPDTEWLGRDGGPPPGAASSIADLKRLLDWVHYKYCLLRPYFETENYPLVEPRELLPSFEVDLYEYKQLPGFSMVAFDRPLSAFQEVFQYDALHPVHDTELSREELAACTLDEHVQDSNRQVFRSRLPRRRQKEFLSDFEECDLCAIESYERVVPYLLQLERAHILAKDGAGQFALQGIYASLPSDLDTELKRFGLRIGKFRPGDNRIYECNRLFVYQFLMELYGFPIVSERRTSAALFARRLHRMGESFLVRVLGQSDRTITTIMTPPRSGRYPLVEKTALFRVRDHQKSTVELLDDHGYFVDRKNHVIILRVTYQQHAYNSKNVQEDRALSVLRQEVVHPITGQVLDHLTLINDATSMVLSLNDIVRGEFQGTITYKRQEILKETTTHEDRLKFLYSWLTKHQHRIIEYSDDFFAKIVQVLEGYLLSPDNGKTFNRLNELHQDVWARYSHILQARQIKVLEDLSRRKDRGETIGYLNMLKRMTDILSDLRFEIVNYFDNLVISVLQICQDVLDDAYLVRTYVDRPDKELTGYGLDIKKQYGKLVALTDEFRSIRRTRALSSGRTLD